MLFARVMATYTGVQFFRGHGVYSLVFTKIRVDIWGRGRFGEIQDGVQYGFQK